MNLLLLAAAVTATQAAAIQGVKGRIFDGVTQEPLIEATIKVVKGGSGTVLTDVDGNYELLLEPGTYELRAYYELYETRRITGVVVQPGEMTTIDVALTTDEGAVEEVVVEAKADTRKETAVLQERKRAAVASDAISAQEIAKSPDSGAADAVKRVVAATVVDGKYMFVRGLGGRYGVTLLNGVTLPSTEPDEQAVPLDLFPAALLANLTIAKTYQAELPGTFGGGALLIETNSYPSDFELKLKLSGALDSATGFDQLPLQSESSLDFFGFGGGSRALPTEVPTDRPMSDRRPGELEQTEVERISESFANRWSLQRAGSRPGFGLGATLGDSLEIDGKKAGYLASFNFGNRLTMRRTQVGRASRSDSGGIAYDQPLLDSEIGVQNASLGGLVNASLEMSRDHELNIFSLYTHAGDVRTQQITGFNTRAREDLRVDHLEVVERSLIFSQLTGDHRLGELRLEWQGNFSRTTRDQPDTRDIAYAAQEDGRYRFHQESAERFYSELLDFSYGAGVQSSLPISAVTVVASGSVQASSRTFGARRFVMDIAGGDSFDRNLLYLPPDQIFAPQNVGFPGFLLREKTKTADAYDASLLIAAGSLSADLATFDPLRVVAGARYEVALQEVDVGSPFGVDQNEVPRTDRTDPALIPSINAVYALTPSMNLRAAYSYTLARPTFRELAAFSYYDFVRRRSISGNPDLEQTRIHAGDLRWEWFKSESEVIAAGIFGKQFHRPIERVIANQANQDISFANAAGASALGVELEARSSLAFLHEVLADFRLGANLSLISSEVELGESIQSAQTSRARPLQGQSPYVLNLNLGWTRSDLGTSVTLLFNVFGARISDVGTGGLPDIYELPFHRLDLALAQNLGGGFGLKLAATNLLNQAVVERQGSLTVFRYQPGVAGSITLEWAPN